MILDLKSGASISLGTFLNTPCIVAWQVLPPPTPFEPSLVMDETRRDQNSLPMRLSVQFNGANVSRVVVFNPLTFTRQENVVLRVTSPFVQVWQTSLIRPTVSFYALSTRTLKSPQRNAYSRVHPTLLSTEFLHLNT